MGPNVHSNFKTTAANLIFMNVNLPRLALERRYMQVSRAFENELFFGKIKFIFNIFSRSRIDY